MAERYGEEWWRDNLCMSRDTFEILCNELGPHLQRETSYLGSQLAG